MVVVRGWNGKAIIGHQIVPADPGYPTHATPNQLFHSSAHSSNTHEVSNPTSPFPDVPVFVDRGY